tara:strand:+ start:7881 stop:9449 length:1569 start_codon:yes stop_codon:yes gene_type:complete
MKRFIVLYLLISNIVFAQEKKPLCFDENFVGAVKESSLCIAGNDLGSCSLIYGLFGAMGGAFGTLGREEFSARKAEKMRFKLNDDNLDSFFKKATYSTKPDPKSSKTYSVDYFSTELADDTVKMLKKKGFKVDQIEKIKKILNEYRSGKTGMQDSMADHDDSELKIKRDLERQAKEIDDALKRKPSDQTLLSKKDKISKKIASFNSMPNIDAIKALGRDSSRLNAVQKILEIQKEWTPKGSMETRAIRGTALGAVTGIGLALAPALRDEVSIRKCKSSIGFKSEEDLSLFRSLGAVDFSNCIVEINPTKLWQVLLMNKKDRDDLFGKSPTLCRAFEKTFINDANHLLERQADINFDRTSCSTDRISTKVRIRGKIYDQTYSLEKGKIVFNGSFVSGVNSEELKSFEQFQMQLNHDLTWTGVHTANPTWGGIPGVRENFSDYRTISSRETFHNYKGCETLSNNETDRKLVNHPSSSNKLMCAVIDQTIASKEIVPQLLNYCGKSLQKTTSEVEATKRSIESVR